MTVLLTVRSEILIVVTANWYVYINIGDKVNSYLLIHKLGSMSAGECLPMPRGWQTTRHLIMGPIDPNTILIVENLGRPPPGP